MPRYASTRQALGFAQSKSDWLASRFAEALPVITVEPGATIGFCGEEQHIDWSPDFPRAPICADGVIRVGGPRDRVKSRVLRWMKEQARAAYADDLRFYCERAGVDEPRLSIGDARRRWGSCSGGRKSGERAIRLSWRLIMAPPSVRRSVAAHEVAHLVHMNHSADFYGLLDSIFEGDRRQADRWLKAHGGALHLVGA